MLKFEIFANFSGFVLLYHLSQTDSILSPASIRMIVKVDLNFFSFPICLLYYRNKLGQLLIRIVIAVTVTAIWRFPRSVRRFRAVCMSGNY